MVELLIRDIAADNRDDPEFPYLRCFDIYAGHSWASGHADFGDGNNQESSSEALNAWYGIALWGAVMGNDRIRDIGLALFNTERVAAEEYWFDTSGTNFPEAFPEPVVGMVWGGKADYATWFSAAPDHIHGINWLPFTPASLYLGSTPAHVASSLERLEARQLAHAGDGGDWGDLVLMYGALADPASAVRRLEDRPGRPVESGNSAAFMDQWCRVLDRHGLVDAQVTADHPHFAVFNKDGRRTRVVYNYSDHPLDVRFSDDVTLRAEPQGLTIRSDEGRSEAP